MRALAKLFGRSPFAPLLAHMQKVAKCVHMLPSVFEAIDAGDHGRVERIAKKVSKAEHDADLTKNDIRGSLKSHLFLPVARLRLLEVLTLQDALADKAEDIAVILTFRQLQMPEMMRASFEEFLKKNLEAFEACYTVINEIREIMETTFGGSEADKLRSMVDKVAFIEHEVDILQRSLLKIVFNNEDLFTFATFHLWMRVIEEVGGLSDLAEKLANSVLIAMEVK